MIVQLLVPWGCISSYLFNTQNNRIRPAAGAAAVLGFDPHRTLFQSLNLNIAKLIFIDISAKKLKGRLNGSSGDLQNATCPGV